GNSAAPRGNSTELPPRIVMPMLRPFECGAWQTIAAIFASQIAVLLDAFDDPRYPLADADAHRDERVTAAAALQLPGRGQRDARTRGAERMADRDRAAVRVDPSVVERDFETTKTGEDLRREGLVDLDHVDVLQRQPG